MSGAPLYLKESRVSSFPDLLNLILEYTIFYRWIYFKNRPRGNLLFVRALLSVSFFFGIYFAFFGDLRLVLTGIEIDPAITWFMAIAVGYSSMLNVFHRKSEHCSSLYHELLREIGRKNELGTQLLSSALARELLTLDLWAHRSYTWFLRDVIEAALQSTTAPNRIQFTERLDQGKVEVRELRSLIDDYERRLMRAATA